MGKTTKADVIVQFDAMDDASVVVKHITEEIRRTGAEAAAAKRQVNGIGGAARDVQSAAEKLSSGWAAVAGKAALVAGAFYGAKQAAEALVGAIEEGGRARALGQLIDEIKGGARMVEAMREGLMGAVDTTTIQGFVRLGSQFGMTAEQFRIAGGYALTYSQTMGKELLPTVERVMQAFASGSADSFKSLGIQAKNAEDALQQMAAAVDLSMAATSNSIQTHIAAIKADYDNMISDINELVAESAVLLVRGEAAFTRMYSPQIIGVTAELNKELDDINAAILEQQRIIEIYEGTGWYAKRLRDEQARLDLLREQEKALWDQVRSQRALYEESQRLAELQGVVRDDTSFPDPNRPESTPKPRPRGGGGRRRAVDTSAFRDAEALARIRARETADLAQYLVDLAAAELEREMGLTGDGETMPGGGDPNAAFKEANAALEEVVRAQSELRFRYIDNVSAMAESSIELWRALGDLSGSKKAVQVMRGFEVASLAVLAVTAGVKAAYEWAEGFAAAGRYDWLSAGNHFTAAVGYTAVAAGKASQAATTIRSMGGSGRSAASSAADFSRDFSRPRESTQQTVTSINIGTYVASSDRPAFMGGLMKEAERGGYYRPGESVGF